MANSLILTTAGIAEIVNAEHSGTAPVKIVSLAYGTGKYAASASQTRLREEFKRVTTLSGDAVGDNVIHMTATDSSESTYSVYEVGVMTEKGTLLAVYSQSTPIIQKAQKAQSFIAIDIALTDFSATSVSFGDSNFLTPPATTETQGVVRLSTSEEIDQGTDAFSSVTPKTLAEACKTLIPRELPVNGVHGNRVKDKTLTFAKLATDAVATDQEAINGTLNTKVMTPHTVKKALEQYEHADNSVPAKKLQAGTLTFDRLASEAVATDEQARAGTSKTVLMTPHAVKQEIDAFKTAGVPSGTVVTYAGQAVPDGWLLCNGAAVSRTTYAALFAAIGTIYGAGDGRSTFNLPNMHRRFAEMTTSVAEVGQKIEAGLPDISGQGFGVIDKSGARPSGAFKAVNGFTRNFKGGENHHSNEVTFSASRSNSIYNSSSTTVQPSSIRLLPIIKS